MACRGRVFVYDGRGGGGEEKHQRGTNLPAQSPSSLLPLYPFLVGPLQPLATRFWGLQVLKVFKAPLGIALNSSSHFSRVVCIGDLDYLYNFLNGSSKVVHPNRYRQVSALESSSLDRIVEQVVKDLNKLERYVWRLYQRGPIKNTCTLVGMRPLPAQLRCVLVSPTLSESASSENSLNPTGTRESEPDRFEAKCEAPTRTQVGS